MKTQKPVTTDEKWKHLYLGELTADVYCVAENVEEKEIKNLICYVLDMHMYDWCLQHNPAFHVYLRVTRDLSDIL